MAQTQTEKTTANLNCDISGQLKAKLERRKRDIGIPLARQVEDALYAYFKKLETGK